MARRYDEYAQHGATIAGIVIDSPGQNAAMAAKLHLPFPLLSDPDGEQVIKPYNAWDDQRSFAKPAVIIVAPDGREIFSHIGSDLMDRPDDDEILEALSDLDLQPIPAISETVSHITPEPGRRALPLHDLAPYMRGIRSSSAALAGRARDEFHRAQAERTVKMAESNIAAQAATARLEQG